MEINAIYHRSPHHAQNSGYNRLLDYLPAHQIPSKKSAIPYRLAKFISNFTHQDYGIYDSTSIYKDMELFQKLFTSRREHCIVHYLNAERDIRFALKYKSLFKSTSFCGTFHKPPHVLKEQIKHLSYLKKMDGAIAVGINQVDFLKEWLSIDSVAYIPHGIDVEFFEPSFSQKNAHTLLFVGQHLRDFETFNKCIPIIAQRVKNLVVNVIIRKDYYVKIKPHTSITLFSDLDDTQLKKQYQDASILFLPLLDATACNSILEAMACGLPIVTNDVGGVSEYLKNTENVLVPKNDFDSLIEATVNALGDYSNLLAMSETSRAKSLDYDWNVVANQVTEFYNLITPSINE